MITVKWLMPTYFTCSGLMLICASCCTSDTDQRDIGKLPEFPAAAR